MWENTVYIFYLLAAYMCSLLFFKMPNSVIYCSKFAFYVICTQIVSLFLIPVMALRPRSPKNGYMFAQILKHMTKVLGVTWELRNGKVLREERGAVVISNHQSSLDILGLLYLSNCAKKSVLVCKKELLYIFPFGLAAYLTGCIFIDRKKPIDALNTLKAAGDMLFKNETKICLYPEGTRNNNAVKLQPFKKGAFALAIACQAPIIPLVLSPYHFLDEKKRIFNKGHVIIQGLEAVPTEGLTMDDLPELKDRVQNMMELAYEELRRETMTTAQN